MKPSIGVTFDCSDPRQLVRFWAEVLDYDIEGAEDTWGAIVDPEGDGPRILFFPVPETKTAKNRVHLDLHVDDPEAALETAIELGGRKIETHLDEAGGGWTVLADPEGNEFCITRHAEASQGE